MIIRSAIIKIFLLLFTILSCTKGYAQQQLTFDDIPLTWDDFKKVKKTKSGSASSIFHGFRRNLDLHDSIMIIHSELYIDTAKSEVQGWEKATTVQKDLLLLHEKGHIVIAFLYHKMLEKTLASMVFTCRGPVEIINVYKKFEDLLDKIHDKYDTETHHGADYYKQKAWENKLMDQLNSTYPHQTPIAKTFSLEIKIPALINKEGDPLPYDYCKGYTVAFSENFNEPTAMNLIATDSIAHITNGSLVVDNTKDTTQWAKQWHPSIDYTKDFEIEIRFQIEKNDTDRPYAYNLYWGNIGGLNAGIRISTEGNGMLTQHYREDNKENITDTFTFWKIKRDDFSRLNIRKTKDKYYIFMNNKFVKEMPAKSMSGQDILVSISEKAKVKFDHLNIYYLN